MKEISMDGDYMLTKRGLERFTLIDAKFHGISPSGSEAVISREVNARADMQVQSFHKRCWLSLGVVQRHGLGGLVLPQRRSETVSLQSEITEP